MNSSSPLPPPDSLGRLINVVAYRIRRDLSARLNKHRLDVTVWPILYCLWEEDGLSQAEIGERVELPGYRTSRGVDRLEAAGLVERRNDPDNRRLRRVFLTEAGRDCQSELIPLTEETKRRVLGQLNDDEQEQLLRLLRKILQML